MIYSKIFGLSSYLLAFCTAVAIADGEGCTEEGIKASGGHENREFKICSKDSDGRLTLKTVLCDEDSHFSSVEERCVANPQEEEPEEEPEEEEESEETSYFAQPPPPPPPPTQLLQHNPHAPRVHPQLVYAPRVHHLPGYAPPVHRQPGYGPRRSNHCSIGNGKYCFSCNTLITCRNHQIVNVEHCTGCDPYDNRCTDQYIPECVNDHFYCTSLGVFPDPFFCNRFHFCPAAGRDKYTFNCPSGMRYDGEKCRKHKNQPKYNYYSPCPNFQKCDYKYQTRIMMSNPQYFSHCDYKTRNGLKTIYKCDNGQQFNNYFCVRKN